MIYCVIPQTRESDLLEPLRKHFESSPQIEVIVDRRAGRPVSPENVQRRNTKVPRARWLSPELAECGVVFEQRLSTVTSELADLPTDDLAASAALGHVDAATELYWRFYETIEQRLRIMLKTKIRQDPFVPLAFGRLLDVLADPDHYHRPVAALLHQAILMTAAEQSQQPVLVAA